MRRLLTVGIVDAGAASLATFLTTVFAVRYLPADELGVYALFVLAWGLAAVVPHLLVLLPAEVRILDYPEADRSRAFTQTMPLGARVALVAAIGVIVALLPARSLAGSEVLVAFTTTCFVAAFLSPLQDHIRRLLHMAGRSAAAAAVSLAQLTIVALALAGLLATDVDPAWAPFGALALANAGSLVSGMLLARARGDELPHREFTIRELSTPSGLRLLVVGAVGAGTDFLAGWLVAGLAGATVLGLTAAAYVAARPIGVFATGVSAVISPRSMEAGRTRNAREGIRLTRLGRRLILAAGLAYLLIAGFVWPLNPVVHLLPAAYAVSGLVALSIVGIVLEASVFPENAQLIGGGRESDLIVVEGVATTPVLLFALTAGVTGSYAIPLGSIGYGVVRWGGLAWAMRRLHGPRLPGELGS